MAFDQYQYIADFKRERYFEFALCIPKGFREVLKNKAKEHGVTTGELVKMALKDVYGLHFYSEGNDGDE